MRKLLGSLRRWQERRHLQDLHSYAAVGWAQAAAAGDTRRQWRLQKIMDECREQLKEGASHE